jgi:hypothetical protein
LNPQESGEDRRLYLPEKWKKLILRKYNADVFDGVKLIVDKGCKLLLYSIKIILNGIVILDSEFGRGIMLDNDAKDFTDLVKWHRYNHIHQFTNDTYLCKTLRICATDLGQSWSRKYLGDKYYGGYCDWFAAWVLRRAMGVWIDPSDEAESIGKQLEKHLYFPQDDSTLSFEEILWTCKQGCLLYIPQVVEFEMDAPHNCFFISWCDDNGRIDKESIHRFYAHEKRVKFYWAFHGNHEGKKAYMDKMALIYDYDKDFQYYLNTYDDKKLTKYYMYSFWHGHSRWTFYQTDWA